MRALRLSYLPLLVLVSLTPACDTRPVASGSKVFPIDHTCDVQPSPARFKALRIGQSREEVKAALGTSLWFAMRSDAATPAIEARTTSPSGTNLTYMFLFVDDRLDCVLVCDGDFIYQLGASLLDGGGHSDYVERLRADAQPLASIDFARVKPLDESSKQARNVAYLYSILTLHDGVGETLRGMRNWQEATDSIQFGATRASVHALLRDPVVVETSPGGDTYETFSSTRRECDPITVVFRDDKVRAVFARPPHPSLHPRHLLSG